MKFHIEHFNKSAIPKKSIELNSEFYLILISIIWKY